MQTVFLELEKALFQAWSLESSSKWIANNPAAGQCGVTALVVQDRLGGDILRTWLDSGGTITTALVRTL
jgi:hypothetical protein